MDFKYDHEQDYENNFYRWFLLNSQEKFEIGEKPYTENEAKRIFNELFGREMSVKKLEDVFKERESKNDS